MVITARLKIKEDDMEGIRGISESTAPIDSIIEVGDRRIGILRAMLPPIHKSTNELLNEHCGSGTGAGFYKGNDRKQDAVSVGALSSFSPVLDRMAERLHTLEGENEYFRGEIQSLRQFYSSNQQLHENDKLSVGKVAEDLQRLAHSFNTKLQADMNHHQHEQQKAALLFAEVSRLGHRFEGLEKELRGVVDNTHRKFEALEQHTHFMASVSSKQQQQDMSPSRNSELQRQLNDIQDAMIQLRSELDTDRSARRKNDATNDTKLGIQLARLNSKLMGDKRDIARALDEQRQLVTGADFQRLTSYMREFSRVNDHLLALERRLHSEFGQIKRVFQALAGDVDARFQCVLSEVTNGLKMWHAAQAQHEAQFELRFHGLEEAVRVVTIAVQSKLCTMEEVIPLEVQARQKNDDKLRRRVERVVKALSHAIETSRGEYLTQQSTLAERVHQLELIQDQTSDEVNMQSMLVHRMYQLELSQQNASEEINMQHNTMRETIQAFMEDSNAMLIRLAAVVEQERVKGIQLVTVREKPPVDTSTHLHEELAAEVKRLKEELETLHTTPAQNCRKLVPSVTEVAPEPVVTEDIRVETLPSWMTMHAQECRQFFDFLNWSVDDVRREIAVVHCLDAVIDQIIETQACGDLSILAKGVDEIELHVPSQLHLRNVIIQAVFAKICNYLAIN
ncbi:hypothetical protein PHMEG_00016751 [Phytophthora megakarya]|uniref:Uncharacterized protein n=1 Tax=Phytophthora megakarya TaxID=4795 RepID=A0A225VZ43_9STRA|nr:hypothetical protein PHMEG_00016751 [Phytophthora megakarya]